MPLSGKMLKKREQARDAANGVVRSALEKRKMETAKKDVNCAICGTTFKLTKKNVDARMHAESRHADKSFAECFPECVAAEEADKKANTVAKKVTTTKKKDDSAALLAEGLAGAAAAAPKKR
mmetsp:Transcript_36652/g.117556  ORF Transcript_36652/g.117556 Transcript_36652/m.117556 type:complete len:122 (-) Transcript_36652:1778-2143(-)